MSRITIESLNPTPPDTSYAGRLNVLIESNQVIFRMLEEQDRKLSELDRMLGLIWNHLTGKPDDMPR